MTLPLYKNMTATVLEVLRNISNSAKIQEIEKEVAEILNLDEIERAQIHKGRQTKLHNRVSWALFYLKTKGYVDCVKRGHYKISKKGFDKLSKK